MSRLAAVTHNTGRVAGHNGVGRNVPSDNAVHTNNNMVSNGDTITNTHSGTQPNIIAYSYTTGTDGLLLDRNIESDSMIETIN